MAFSLFLHIYTICDVNLFFSFSENIKITEDDAEVKTTLPQSKFMFPLSLLSHLLIAGCDIGVQISVRPYVRPFVHPSTFTSKFGFLDINDSCQSQTLHSNCP